MTIQNYVQAIQTVLNSALCLRDFPSEIVEKHNKPEIEMFSMNKDKCKPLNLNPIYIARSEKEKCLIEPSINSCRVLSNEYFFAIVIIKNS